MMTHILRMLTAAFESIQRVSETESVNIEVKQIIRLSRQLYMYV